MKDETKKPNGETKTALEITLEKIQSDMAEMKKKDEEKDKTIKMLTEIANESRKEKWNEKNIKNKIISIVKLSTIDGKVIVSWKNIIDEVFKNAQGDWTENQVNNYITSDGETITLSLLDAVRKIIKIEAEVLSIRVDKEIEGKDYNTETTYIYKVKTKDGKEFELSSKFIN